MTTRRLIVSSIGISLLFSHQTAEERAGSAPRLIDLANDREIAPEHRPCIDSLAARIQETLNRGDVAELRRKSAELNGIYAITKNQIAANPQDVHLLITTDTALGRLCGKEVEAFLQSKGLATVPIVPRNLSAGTSEAFEEGSKDLIQQLATTLPDYKEQAYTIIFNLVAAFKVLQGYLNTLGMFYADEIVYLFEGQNAQAISIPRLPIQIDTDSLRPFQVQMAMMAEGDAHLPVSQLQGLPRAIYDQLDGVGFLSDWGLLIWQQIKENILGADLLDFPRLHFTDAFKRDFNRANPTERSRLQSTLAHVSALLEESQGNPAILKGRGGIQYDNYRGKQDAGSPIGHFRISDGIRVSAIAKEGRLHLRHYGAHDYVNDNP